jgi:hypothetical protein
VEIGRVIACLHDRVVVCIDILCFPQVYDLRMMRQTPPLSFAPAMNAPTLLGADMQTLPLLAHDLIHRTASSLVSLAPC